MSAVATEPPDWIAGGHLELLQGVHEFARELEGCTGDHDTLEVVRGAAAFLRHSLLPFASAEQAALGDDFRGDSAALDHAFLGVEIERLMALVREIGEEGAFSHLPRLRRVIHRIEAVLELHAERERLLAEPEVELAPAGTGLRSLDDVEITAFLAAQQWGVLAVNGPAGPYAVPVSFALSGRSIVIASGPGRKLSALQADGRACLTVSAVRNGEDWSCVVAQGRLVPVTGLFPRARALHALARGRVSPGLARLRQASAAAVFRMEPVEVTGRTRR